MNILLINPPTPGNEIWVREGRCQQFDIWGAPFPPLTLAYIAGQLEKQHDALIIDSGPEHLDINQTLQKSAAFNPHLIIISTATPTIDSDLGWFADECRKILPGVLLGALGIHVTRLPDKTMIDYPLIDFLIRGEPEKTAVELVNALHNDADLQDILGLTYRKNGTIVNNSDRPFIKDLDTLNHPAWPGVDYYNYLMPIIGKPFTLITFARGCPHSCKFCILSAYYGHQYRKRSPEKIIAEIRAYMSQGIFDFLFWTEYITADKEYLDEFLNLLQVNNLHNKIRWVTNSRVDFGDYEMFLAMRKAGCWQIVFGLEFGSDAILAKAGKGKNATAARGRQAVKEASRAGLAVDGHFIMGYPGESEKDLQATIDQACSLPLTFAHFYSATPFPGSQLYDDAVESNLLVSESWRYFSQDMINIKIEGLHSKIINSYVQKAYKKFYLRFQIFWRIGTIANGPIQFFNIIKLGVGFLKSMFKN